MADRHPSDFPEIDFSEFHDLAHAPFTRHCRALPGGWRWHLALAWEYPMERDIARPVPLSLRVPPTGDVVEAWGGA